MCVLDFAQHSPRVVVPGKMVIMVEDVHKVGEKVINDSLDVEEMEMRVEVTCNQARRFLNIMIGLGVMISRARMRQRCMMSHPFFVCNDGAFPI